ncbi:MAG: hypothetical protein R3F43_26760 [bacterium]
MPLRAGEPLVVRARGDAGFTVQLFDTRVADTSEPNLRVMACQGADPADPGPRPPRPAHGAGPGRGRRPRAGVRLRLRGGGRGRPLSGARADDLARRLPRPARHRPPVDGPPRLRRCRGLRRRLRLHLRIRAGPARLRPARRRRGDLRGGLRGAGSAVDRGRPLRRALRAEAALFHQPAEATTAVVVIKGLRGSVEATMERGFPLCDPAVAEDVVGAPCTAGVGPCAAEGRVACAGDARARCDAPPPPHGCECATPGPHRMPAPARRDPAGANPPDATPDAALPDAALPDAALPDGHRRGPARRGPARRGPARRRRPPGCSP